MLIGIGAGHFLAPSRSTTSFPTNCRVARGSTLASGVAEVGVRAMLWCRGPGEPVRWPRPALFLAVFPANLNMVRLWWNKPGAAKWPMRIGALARLPLRCR